MPKEKKLNLKRTARISVHPCCFSNPRLVSPPYHPLSPPTNYQSVPSSSLNASPLLSPIMSLGIPPSKILLTPKTTPPPLTSPLPAPTQPSKHSLPLAINLDLIELLDDSQSEACPTVSGLEAEPDRANILKTSTLPHDLPPRVTSLAADKGSMQQQLNDLMDLCTRLQRQQTEMATKITAQDLEIASLKARIKMLEDKDGGVVEPSREDATIKGRILETGEEAGVDKSTERGSNDTKELVNVLTSLYAVSILTSRVQVVNVPPAAEVATVSVPTGSGMVPAASPIFTTASVVTPYARRKGKEKMVESDTPKKKKLQEQIDVQMAREIEEQLAREDQRMNEQIARDAKIARIHAEEELYMLIDSMDKNNETIAKYLQEYEQFAADLSIEERIELINDLVKYQDNYAKVLKYQSQQRKPLSKKQQREFYIVKRKGLRLEQESAKKVKTSEEVSEEDLKTMMQLVPVEEVYVEALQVKCPIINWEIYTKWPRTYWKIIKLGGNTAVYQFFVDMLKNFDREDLNQLWTLVKETLSIRQATSDKEKELWVELKRLFEPYRSRNFHAGRKGLPIEEGTCNIKDKELIEGILFKSAFDFGNLIVAQEHRDLYDALFKSYKLDKDLLESYGNAYSLKRDREDKDKDEDPPAGSDLGLKKRKTSKDAEPSKGSKSKELKSISSKGTNSQPKSSGKSTQAEELVFESADTEMPQNQGSDLGNTDDQPNIKEC
nr:hypothetical protein [Tanacetum cinerariifolium]